MNTANLLSLSRLLLAPFILVFFSRKNLYGVIALWALAALTDFLDGRLARKRGEISELGKILDPLADKMTLGCSFIALMIRRRFTRLAWRNLYHQGAAAINGRPGLFEDKAEGDSQQLLGESQHLRFLCWFVCFLFQSRAWRAHSLPRSRPFLDCLLYLLPECPEEELAKRRSI